uniref:G-protein coupled receptors family 1 profile domain-containing protein n=1 Tax=Oryzias latipes TaxID=8090 RepID=A0A3P9HEZ0_ORYLA
NGRGCAVALPKARSMRSHIVSLQSSAHLSVKKSELKAAAALGVVVFMFLVCFCPYFYSNIAGLAYKSSDFLAVFVTLLFYCNSCLNPVIYAFFYPCTAGPRKPAPRGHGRRCKGARTPHQGRGRGQMVLGPTFLAKCVCVYVCLRECVCACVCVYVGMYILRGEGCMY